eukprot:CAMPEP_0176425604 /NCGR_PEP_ID=MMETSP0127-20121128/11478_1 /TAXON_ID=938130 /ORGANISM="Platyophrya macrostoma, Strain WH" /LENGTH=585 /DNA_ID=CAMNT_0017806777 /DNA_START=180 /DNA_END=1937 /DNA_ORIENTATION=+
MTNEHVLSRSVRTLVNACRIGYLYKTTDPSTPEEFSALHTAAAQLILNTCLQNEGLYIKLGQGMSAINHVLPMEYISTLRVLLDQAPVVPLEEVKRIFREETGKSFQEVFESFDDVPVASASIAQVHRARLRVDANASEGTATAGNNVVDVAVKIQKPNIKKQIWWDLQCYFLVCRMLQYAFDLPLMWSATCIADNLTKEIDFLLEASNADRAREHLTTEKRFDLYVPKVYRGPLLTKRLMVTEWIDGIKLVDVSKVEAAKFSKADVMQSVISGIGDMIFKHGFVHCDPHPANIMVRPRHANHDPVRSKKNPKPFEVVILDFGLCVEERESFRLQYALFFKSIFTADRSTLLSIVSEWGIGNADIFASLTLQKPYTTNTVRTGEVTPDDVRAMEQAMKSNIKKFLQDETKVPQELIFVGRSMNLIRALNKSFDAPVNRVNILARCAVGGLGHIRDLEQLREYLASIQEQPQPQPIDNSSGASDSQRRAAASTTSLAHLQRERGSVLRNAMWALWLEFVFECSMWWLAVAHRVLQMYATMVALVVPSSMRSHVHVGNLEEQLERKEEDMVRRHKFHHAPLRINGND